MTPRHTLLIGCIVLLVFAGICLPVSAATLRSIAITTPVTKLSYTVGDTLDLTGLVVTGTYNDSSTQVETITAADVTGFSSAAANPSETLTITYSGKTTTYTVVINTAPVTLTAYHFGRGNGICCTGNRWNADYSFIINARLSTIYRYKPDLVANQ